MSHHCGEESSLAEVDLYDGAYGPSVLIILVEKESIAWLRGIFKNMVDTPFDSTVSLAELPRVNWGASLDDIVFSRVPQPLGRKFTHETPGRFLWKCTSSEWATMSLLLEPLLRQPGHQYLTSEETDDALVEVSFGEEHRQQALRDRKP
jgi:hypothetical protein